jgi:hypothetical protein
MMSSEIADEIESFARPTHINEDSVVLGIAQALQSRTDFYLQQPPEIPKST